MEQTWYTSTSAEALRGAFGRIAQPYPGTAPRAIRAAKVGRGDEFYTHSVR